MAGTKIIDSSLDLIVMVAIVPVAIAMFFNVTTATWSVEAVAVWGVVIIIFIVALIQLIRHSMLGKRR